MQVFSYSNPSNMHQPHTHSLSPTHPPPPTTGLTSDSNLVVALSHSLLNTATMPLTPTLRPLISPTLMESALWAVARWGATYLCPEEPLPRVLEGAFGRPGKGPAIVERLLQAGLQCLTEYPAEGALHEVCVCVLGGGICL